MEQSSISPRSPGLVCTFYSYKGGVGRSMVLANIAAMLARWKQKVLVVDWDLEAPGLERYFGSRLRRARAEYDGLVDLVHSFGRGEPLDWRKCVVRAPLPECNDVHILHAGRAGDIYLDRLRSIDWERLFNDGFGTYLEKMRAAWKDEYDYVLLDSRTGITDIGGICTILMPDYLISLFTTTDQSIEGVKDAMERARARQGNLPLNRRRMIIIPIAARDESGTEYERAAQWRKRFAQELSPFYADWIHKDETPESVLDFLKIPYVPFWSFGEHLPVLEEDPQNPKTLAYSYTLIARLIHSRLDWTEVREGRKTSEIQKQFDAEAKAKLAEAEKAQAQAAALQQAGAIDSLMKRETVVKERYEVLLAAASRSRKYLLFATVAAAYFVLVATYFLIENPYELTGKSLNTFVLGSLFWAASGVATLYFLLARRRAGSIVESLKREYVAYSVRTGGYRELGAGARLRLLAQRIEELADVGKKSLFTTFDTNAAGEPAAPSSGNIPSKTSQATAPPEVPHDLASAVLSGSEAAPASGVAFKRGEPADVLLSYLDGGITSDWIKEFAPLFQMWLSESLGRDARVLDVSRLPPDTDWQTIVDQGLSNAGAGLVVATSRYFASDVTGRQFEILQRAPIRIGYLASPSIQQRSRICPGRPPRCVGRIFRTWPILAKAFARVRATSTTRIEYARLPRT